MLVVALRLFNTTHLLDLDSKALRLLRICTCAMRVTVLFISYVQLGADLGELKWWMYMLIAAGALSAVFVTSVSAWYVNRRRTINQAAKILAGKVQAF